MKNNVITLRLTGVQKTKLEDLAEEKGITITELVRPFIENLTEEAQIIPLGDGRFYNTVKDNKLIFNLGLAELCFWIYDKANDTEALETNDFYRHLIKIIETINTSRIFSSEVLFELDKIKSELVHYLMEPFTYFKFPMENGFDYELFHEAMHTIRFDSENNQIIPF